MDYSREDLQASRSYLVAARNLLEQAARQVEIAYSHARPGCLPPGSTTPMAIDNLATRLGHGIDELEEQIEEGTHADAQ